MLGARYLLLLLFLVAGTAALAQTEAFGLQQDHAVTPGEMAPARDTEPRLRFALGVGVAAAPTFAGSDDYRLRPVPVVSASYGPFFLGAGGLGANLYRDSRWRFSALLSPGRGRRESDDAHLAGLGDIDRTVRAGLVAAYAAGGFVTRASVLTDIAGEKQGTLAKVDVFARFRPGGRVAIFVGPGISWANREYMQTFFGINAEQSARSGLPEFDARAGTNSLRISGVPIYRIDEHWTLAGSASAARLAGDAADTPITETPAQYLLLAAAVYRFR